MQLERFTGPGSLDSRRKLWDLIVAAVRSSKKLPGKNVSVDEREGYGSVINSKQDQGEVAPSDCPCLQVVFSGVSFTCGCVDISNESDTESVEFTDTGHFNNQEPVQLEVFEGFEPCRLWESEFSLGSGVTFYFKDWFDVDDCSGDPDSEGEIRAKIYVYRQSGTYYVLAYLGGIGVKFLLFSGSSTSLGTINNDLVSCGGPITIDNPLTTFVFGGPIDGFVMATGGTVALTANESCGACCYNPGDCAQMSGAQCAVIGGDYAGDDTLCADTICP